MDFSMAEIGFVIVMAIWGIGMSLYLWIDSLKFKLKNMEYDRDLYRSLYELEKEHAQVLKKYTN